MNMHKPFSQACENNKIPILTVIKDVFTQPVTVWEIGSGTGQHACYFAIALPHLIWQPTDLAENIPSINAWRDEVQLLNLNPPIVLDVTDLIWPAAGIDALFTANTLHIMSWQQVRTFFDRLGVVLNSQADVCIYGPFNYKGNYTSDSNARFDKWLKDRDHLSGIRNFEDVFNLAKNAGLEFINDHAMPANNRLLVFKKVR
ncbi:hypothetical protein MCAMS1_02757 [biofilm metagenome]